MTKEIKMRIKVIRKKKLKKKDREFLKGHRNFRSENIFFET